MARRTHLVSTDSHGGVGGGGKSGRQETTDGPVISRASGKEAETNGYQDSSKRAQLNSIRATPAFQTFPLSRKVPTDVSEAHQSPFGHPAATLQPGLPSLPPAYLVPK